MNLNFIQVLDGLRPNEEPPNTAGWTDSEDIDIVKFQQKTFNISNVSWKVRHSELVQKHANADNNMYVQRQNR